MNDAVEQIKNRLNIIDVISPYVELQKAGKHLKARCPFHNEKTPSFNVSPERGMYHCYGCGAGGDMFTFIEAIEGVDFKGALKILAEKANVELTPVSPERKSERDKWYSALEAATKYYEEQLAKNSEALSYLERRGVKKETIATWRIGLAPAPAVAGWTAVFDALKPLGFTAEDLLKVGLLKESEKGKGPYDVFRNRIMFPIFDTSGRVVAYSGRTLEFNNDEVPKYVNSPETELFKKSEILYGYHKAKQGIRQLDFSLIVEGQFDVVMSHQAGYGNTVAVSGTALTAQHVQLLERLSQKVVLALDADRAGIAAMKKGADLMLRRGLDVKVARLEGGKDPADLVLKDPKEYKHLIGQSMHVIEFLLKVLLEAQYDERTLKLRARDEILPYILLLPNYIDQDYFEGLVAEALKTTKEAVHLEVERLRSKESEAPTLSAVKEVKTEIPASTSDGVMRLYETGLTYLLGALPLFSDAVSSNLKNIIRDITGKNDEEMMLLATVRGQSEVLFRLESFLEKNPRKVFEEEYVHRLNQFRDLVVRTYLKETRARMLEAETSGQEGRVIELMGQVVRYEQARKNPPYTKDILKG